MIVDRYEPVNLLARVPELDADFDAELRILDQLLEDAAIFARIKADLTVTSDDGQRSCTDQFPPRV